MKWRKLLFLPSLHSAGISKKQLTLPLLILLTNFALINQKKYCFKTKQLRKPVMIVVLKIYPISIKHLKGSAEKILLLLKEGSAIKTFPQIELNCGNKVGINGIMVTGYLH